jgi:hypothetical protein
MNIKAEGKNSNRSSRGLSSSETIIFSTDATPAPGVSRVTVYLSIDSLAIDNTSSSPLKAVIMM